MHLHDTALPLEVVQEAPTSKAKRVLEQQEELVVAAAAVVMVMCNLDKA